jgi:hypothetical protein
MRLRYAAGQVVCTLSVTAPGLAASTLVAAPAAFVGDCCVCAPRLLPPLVVLPQLQYVLLLLQPP